MKPVGLVKALALLWLAGLGTEPSTAAPLLWVSTNAAPPSTTAIITVNLLTDTNVAKAQFDLQYNASSLTPATPTGGNALADHVLLTSMPAPGVLRVELVSLSDALLTNGILVFVPFGVSTNAADQDVPLTLTNVTVDNALNQPVPPATLAPGLFRIIVAPSFTLINSTNGGAIHLELAVSPGRTCMIEAAAQPVGQVWKPLTTNQTVTGTISFDDTTLPVPSQRFYRAAVLY